MPIFEKPPLETLPYANERWTPIYLEHGRLEVDDSSVKWIGADYNIIRIPAATVSVILLGPGTTVTHAAIKACSDSNTPICWTGQESMRFYAFGIEPNHDNSIARHHVSLYSSKKKRTEIAKKMFLKRFPESVINECSIKKLRGMEGIRVKEIYKRFAFKYGISWKGRNYDKTNWMLADNVNRALSSANSALYALCTSIICSMGYLPQLGFVHSAGTLPFVFDIADLYKEITTIPASFSVIANNSRCDTKTVISCLKDFIEKEHLIKQIPADLKELMK